MQAPTKGAEISIQDNGTGIDIELTDKIFDPFFTTKETNSGSGFDYTTANFLLKITMVLFLFHRNLGKEVLFLFSYP